tara:strand:+ start:161 stop:409 length:249 start_codon:yes stop_codon:yes gene_type:complete
MKILDQVVDASCGQCLFSMTEKSGCDLAIRVDEDCYFVKGADIDDFGDAHAADGFCNKIHKAKVKGYFEDSVFVISSFELLS